MGEVPVSKPGGKKVARLRPSGLRRKRSAAITRMFGDGGKALSLVLDLLKESR